jgi:hypothetical protein
MATPLSELSLPDEVPDFLPGTAFSLDDLSEGKFRLGALCGFRPRTSPIHLPI